MRGSMKIPIYTRLCRHHPWDPLVGEQWSDLFTLRRKLANPASRSHLIGWKAEEPFEEARAMWRISIAL